MRLLNADRRPPKRVVALAAAVASGAVLVAASAQADFTLTSCGGSNIAGTGSSLQNVAQKNLWSGTAANEFNSADGCPGKVVSYNPGSASGSGAGRKAMGGVDGDRSSVTNNPDGSRFGGTDEPPTPTEQANMNAGNPAVTADNGTIHVIPVATAAMTAVVNLPATCVGKGTNRDASGRLQITGDKLVKAFSNVAGGQTWGDLIQGLSGVGDDADCAAQPIHRIVRQDVSGSTFAFKSYLNKVAGSEAFSISSNQAWPNGTVTAVSSGACTTSVCSGPASGGGNLRTLLNNTPGGIGYLALSDARSGYDYDGGSDAKYWLPIEKIDHSSYIEPTADVNGYRSATWVTNHPGDAAGQLGSNCSGINPTGIPAGADPTTGDWTAVDPSGGAGYPACTFTYVIAFDDDAPVWGASDTEEAKARTVKDYLTYVTSLGQSLLGGNKSDYAPLSLSVRQIAQNGVNQIGWNKHPVTETTVTTTPPTTTTTTTQPTTTNKTTTTQKPPPISNAFTITSATVKKQSVKLTLTVAGAGRLAVKATTKYKGKTITFATGGATVNGGAGSLTLKPSSKALAAIKATKKSKKLKVSVTVQYTPTGGATNTKTTSVSIKGLHK